MKFNRADITISCQYVLNLDDSPIEAEDEDEALEKFYEEVRGLSIEGIRQKFKVIKVYENEFDGDNVYVWAEKVDVL